VRLITEVEGAITDADAAAAAERERALDPALAPDARAALEGLQAIEFGRDRLRHVLPKLKERHQQIAADEYLKKWHAAFATLKLERDALAVELREVYPQFEQQIVGLFARITANDEMLSRLHQARPSDIPLHLRRGMAEFTRFEPSIAARLKLPTFARLAA
jgi:hypothetical protein